MQSTRLATNLELRHLRLVVQIAAHGSVTLAARSLQVTQSALSHQLREIESRIRTPLFIRTPRRMIATGAGEEVARVGRLILAEVERLEHQLYTTAHAKSVVLSEILGPANVTPQRITRIQLTEAIIEMIKAELGVGFLSRWAVAPQLHDGSLVMVKLTDGGYRRSWYAATRSDDPEPAFQRDLLDLLRTHLIGGPVLEAKRIA